MISLICQHLRCTVSLVGLHFLLYRRLIACSALMLSLIHGMFRDLCEATFVCSGACLSITSSKTWLYWSTRPARDDAGSLNNSDFKMSLSNLSCRMFFICADNKICCSHRGAYTILKACSYMNWYHCLYILLQPWYRHFNPDKCDLSSSWLSIYTALNC